MAYKNNFLNNYTIGPAGLVLIKEKEGWYPKAYRDPVGVWTIGYGTTGTDAVPGRTITMDQGEAFLRRDLLEAEAYVKSLVKVPLNQYQFDALVSFVYNLGVGNFQQSTLLKLLNRGNYLGAAGQFGRWNKARDRNTGEWKTLAGLTKRREEERTLFVRPAADDLSHSELNHTSEEMTDPHLNECTVRADAPTENPSPIAEVVKHTDSFKMHMMTLSGFLATMSAMVDQLKSNPILCFTAGIVVAGILGAVYIKYRDVKEGR